MNAPRFGTILVIGILVAGVALVGPAMAHGDQTTAPTNEAANETNWNETSSTWTDHATAWNDRAVPTWMASHMSQADAEWMAEAMGFGPQTVPSDQPQAWSVDQPQAWSAFHQQAWSDDQQSWNESTQYPAQHQQYDDRTENTWGGQYGHGC